MRIFGIDPEQQEVTTDGGRLQRPWTVVIFGVLLSVGFVVGGVAMRAGALGGSGDTVLIGIASFAVFAFALSILYAWIGWQYSRAAARRVVGAIGGLAALIGVAVVAWVLLDSMQ